MVCPEPVHGDPTHQRVVFGYQPASERQPVGRLLLGKRMENRWDPRSDRLSEVEEATLEEDVSGPGLLQLLHDQAAGRSQLAPEFF